MGDDKLLARFLPRLSGQICTPPSIPGWAMTEIRSRRLAVFHEWPSGHWEITEAGRNLMAENSEDA